MTKNALSKKKRKNLNSSKFEERPDQELFKKTVLYEKQKAINECLASLNGSLKD